MTSDLGKVEGRWAGGIVAGLLLLSAGSATARQAATTAPGAQAPAVQTYADCLRAYAARRDAALYCRRLFPATPPVTSYDTCVQATGRTAEARQLCAQRYPDTASKPAAPVDLTPLVNPLIDRWINRPRPPAKPLADPLAVVPGIQAACAAWADDAQRWRRCAIEGWRATGLAGQPPLALRTPPAPPVIDTPPPPPPADPATVKLPPAKPPQGKPEPPIARPLPPDPPVLAQPDPLVEAAPTPAERAPPLKIESAPPGPVDPALPSDPAPPSIPPWAWLLAAVVALLAAGAGGFGLSRWLSRPRPPSARPTPVAGAACPPPDIALVADLGVVTLLPLGPPRAGMAVSMRFVRDADLDGVRLDYPSLETAP